MLKSLDLVVEVAMRIQSFTAGISLGSNGIRDAVKILDNQVNMSCVYGEEIILPYPDTVYYCFNTETRQRDIPDTLVRVVIFRKFN